MTTYRTGNPIGSADPRDLYDNAENLDELVNSQDKAEHPDRLGVPRKTWHGMEQEFDGDQARRESEFVAAQADKQQRFNLLLANSGYEFLADYAAGIEITEYNQVVRDNAGELWRAAATTELPYTTDGTGLPEGGAFVAVGDADIRNDLSAGVGAGKGGLLVRGAVIYVDTVTDLLALDTSGLVDGQQVQVKEYHAGTGIGGGAFYWDATLDAAQHNGGTVISPAAVLPENFEEENRNLAYEWFVGLGGVSNGCWVRLRFGGQENNLLWYGCRGDGISDDSIPIQKCLFDSVWENRAVVAPAGVYLKGFALASDCPWGGARWYDFDYPSGTCVAAIYGEGKSVTEFKVGDGLISERGRFTWTFGFAGSRENAIFIQRDYSINQNGSNNPLGEGDSSYGFEQAHCFRLGSHKESSFYNIEVIDKVGGGLVFAAGISDKVSFLDCSSRDFSGNFGSRADIESQGFGELVSIVGCEGYFIQVESNTSAPEGRRQSIEMTNSKYNTIDFTGGSNRKSFFVKIVNSTAITNTYLSNGTFQVSNSFITDAGNFQWSNWMEGSIVSNTIIKQRVLDDGGVRAIIPRVTPNEAYDYVWKFSNCTFLIDSDDPLFSPDGEGWCINPYTGSTDKLYTARIVIDSCEFDPRFKRIANSYRTHHIEVRNSKIRCTERAFSVGTLSQVPCGLSLINNDYSELEGSLLFIQASANNAPFVDVVIKEVIFDEKWAVSHGSGTTTAGLEENLKTLSIDLELHQDTMPNVGYKGTRVIRKTPTNGEWYQRVYTGGNSFSDAISLPS